MSDQHTADPFGAVKSLAFNCGFSRAGDLDVAGIQIRREVRGACEVNTCKAYDRRWSCPPGCGSLEECERRLRSYRRGLLLQTIGELEDHFDGEGMMEAMARHGRNLEAFSKQVRERYPNCLILGAGACRRCETCAYPGEPCRFPDLMFVSMEAMGMVVSDVCRDNKLPYYYGPNTITYTGCALLE